jgi:hypothetical protein
VGPIELTPAEQKLWDAIYFDPVTPGFDHDRLRASIEPAFQLTKSLLKREAVPDVRLRYVTDPELNVRGHGKSRIEVFERNGTRGDDIFRDPNFHKYLRYFVVGPELPSSTIAAFTELAKRCGMITSGDCDAFCNLARSEARRCGLSKRQAAEELFKLSLEVGLDDGMSRIVRDSVMRTKG